MAVSSNVEGNRLSWSDEIGLLPLFVTLVLPLVIGVIVILKCVYNHCCLRKATAKSYTVKPALKSWKGTHDEEEAVQQPTSNPAISEPNEINPSTSGSVPNSVPSLSGPTPAVPVPGGDDEDRPIPPRRSSSGNWRRSVLAQNQNSTNDNQVNFSGDSQDSRGYTRISVREPLSNIRNQAIRRNGDSHYATVSDDSEEMYAAIEDGDGNYMRIVGDDARHWQEHREANSPLPPVPPPLSPVLLTSAPDANANTTNSIPGNDLLLHPQDSISAIAPPIYAQVTKVKKTKAPMPVSNHSKIASTSASVTSQPPLEIPAEPSPTLPPQPSTSTKNRSAPHHNHASIIIDSADVNSSAEARRWSKADINYSEFEVIREPPFSLVSKTKSTNGELIDEDNYNIVPEVHTTSRISRHRPQSVTLPTSSRTLPHPNSSRSSCSDPHHPYSEISKPPPLPPPLEPPHHSRINDGYAEVAKRNSVASSEDQNHHHPYSELTTKRSSSRSPTGYYQEIGDRKPPGKKRDNLYQKIRRKRGNSASQTQGDESDDDDEDEEEDQFYEKVKSKAPPPPPPPQTDLPNHANPSALKHGYEKIKPKTTPSAGGGDMATTKSSEIAGNDLKVPEDCTTQESDEEGSLYEQVKYTPYERLKESEEDLDKGDGGSADNLYEDISYSRINKSVETRPKSSTTSQLGAGASTEGGAKALAPPPVDVDNLYARVDLTKKKRNTVHSIPPS